MNDLSGKCVNVVLAVEMGRGMEFLEHNVKIVANFNGKLLESDLVDANVHPLFKTELVWETDKKELRRIRSANAPLRVEVQTIDKNNRKERIGFLLLSSRCASIVRFNSETIITFKWHNLLGVSPEFKIKHPALYLSLTIRDLVALYPEDDTPFLSDVTIEEENSVANMLEEVNEKIPIQYLQDGFIQIGSGDCNEMFLLSIIIQVACNLDLLLPEILIFNQNREKYFISFKIFGITIKSKPFCRDLHANIPMNEKIVVRILSEYETLKMYLNEYCQIIVSFYCGSDKLGATQLPVQLLQNLTETEFELKESSVYSEQKCLFKFPSPHGMVPSSNTNRFPFIEVATCICRKEIRPISATVSVPSSASLPISAIESGLLEDLVDTIEITDSIELMADDDRPNQEELSVTTSQQSIEKDSSEKYSSKHSIACTFSKNCVVEELSPRHSMVGDGSDVNVKSEKQNFSRSRPVSACGDQPENARVLELQNISLDLKSTERKTQSEQNLLTKYIEGAQTHRSTGGVKIKPVLMPTYFASSKKVEEIPKKIIIAYQQFCLDIVVENITLKKNISGNKINFRFKHPKASTSITISSEIDNQIDEDLLLGNTRCKMFFISSTEQIRKLVYAWPPKVILLDENNLVLTEELDIYTAMFLGRDRSECTYITECKAIRTYEPLAKISLSMYLHDYGLSALPHPTSSDLLPPILDEEIAIKELRELQDWKDVQKSHYSVDLKILEKDCLLKLQTDWNYKKTQLEEKLSRSVTRCQALSQELQTAVNHIRTKNALQAKETTLNLNWSLQENIQQNIQKYCDCKNKELIETISVLERQNESLKSIISDQRTEMQQIKKTALTKEQTTNLLHQLRGLEEKFEEAQKVKSYFKDQWKKAVKEIHDLRSEEQKVIQEKIQNHKVELNQFNLDGFESNCVAVKPYECDENVYNVQSSCSFENYQWENNVDYPPSITNNASTTSFKNE